jgi:hypothetical protein
MGFAFNEEDIQVTHGGRWKTLNDVIQCWELYAWKDDKKVYIVSGYTLTECQKGIRLEKNTADSCLYGDLLAIPTGGKS